MADNKKALHKEISAIFDGVPLPEGGKRPFSVSVEPDLENTNQTVCSQQVTAEPKPRQSVQPQHSTTQIPPEPAQTPADTKKSERNTRVGFSNQFKERISAIISACHSKKKTNIKLLLPVVLVAVFSYRMYVVFKPSQKPQISTQPVLANVLDYPEIKIIWPMPEPYPAGLDDPMYWDLTTVTDDTADTSTVIDTSNPVVAVDTVESAKSDLIVKGILYSDDNPSAIVGNKIVSQGQNISGVTIVKITESTVEFEKDGERWSQQVQE